MTKLNYDAQAPITGDFNTDVKPSSKGPNPPGDYKFKDYIPKEPQQRTERSPATKDNVMRRPVARYETDFISGADAAVKRAGERSKIKELAKQIYADHNKRKAQYDAALALIDAASAQEKENPSPELAKAMRIARKVRPISKEEAIEAAEKQFYGTLS